MEIYIFTLADGEGYITNYQAFNATDVDMSLHVMVNIRVSSATVTNRWINCCVDTITDYTTQYNIWLLNRNKRLGT